MDVCVFLSLLLLLVTSERNVFLLEVVEAELVLMSDSHVLKSLFSRLINIFIINSSLININFQTKKHCLYKSLLFFGVFFVGKGWVRFVVVFAL